MNKLKKFYNQNRIFCILMIICLVCGLLWTVSGLMTFLGQTSSSVYGNRLKEIDKHKVDKDMEAFENYFAKGKGVVSAKARLQGKIIYITVEMNKDVSNDDIQNLATGSLDKISEDNRNYYDIQFIFKRDGMSPYMASKSSNNTFISWANYNFETTTTSTTTTKKKK